MKRLLPFLLAHAAESVSNDLAQIYNTVYGLTRPEWRILVALNRSGPALSRDLAPLTALDKVQISRGVARLFDKKLIEKQIVPSDGRARMLKATEAGQSLYQEIIPKIEHRVDELFDDISPGQREELRHTLIRLAERANSGHKT